MGLGRTADLPPGDFPPPSLDPVQQRVLDDLRRDGIAIVDFRELFRDDELWAKLERDVAVFAAETEEHLDEYRQRAEGKSYLVRRFGGRPGDAKRGKVRFKADDRWLQLGLSSTMLDVVNSYRGRLTHLLDLDTWYTIPDPEAHTRVESQRWHRDAWDNHIVKVFTYFSDVDEDAGPFEYVRGSAEGGRYGELWAWEAKGVYPPQDEFEAAVDPSDVVTITGSPGTMFFCDSSGFHRGGWARTKPRVLSYFTYVGPGATKNPRYKVKSNSLEGVELTPEAEFAVSRSLKRKKQQAEA